MKRNKVDPKIVSRRDFLKTAVMGGAAISINPLLSPVFKNVSEQDDFDVVGGLLSEISNDT